MILRRQSYKQYIELNIQVMSTQKRLMLSGTVLVTACSTQGSASPCPFFFPPAQHSQHTTFEWGNQQWKVYQAIQVHVVNHSPYRVNNLIISHNGVIESPQQSEGRCFSILQTLWHNSQSGRSLPIAPVYHSFLSHDNFIATHHRTTFCHCTTWWRSNL